MDISSLDSKDPLAGSLLLPNGDIHDPSQVTITPALKAQLDAAIDPKLMDLWSVSTYRYMDVLLTEGYEHNDVEHFVESTRK